MLERFVCELCMLYSQCRYIVCMGTIRIRSYYSSLLLCSDVHNRENMSTELRVEGCVGEGQIKYRTSKV